MPRADRLSPSGVKLLQEKHLAVLSTLMPDGAPLEVRIEPHDDKTQNIGRG